MWYWIVATSGQLQRSPAGVTTSQKLGWKTTPARHRLAGGQDRPVCAGENPERSLRKRDFMGFSYGFRPGRSQHDALDALATGLVRTNVNWVLGCRHQSVLRQGESRMADQVYRASIGDRRVIRLIRKWLSRDVGGGSMASNGGRHPQVRSSPPLLANIYLHYVFDLWAHKWRRRYATGNVVMVRYADDVIVRQTIRCPAACIAMQRRLRESGLTVHPEKTCLMESGRLPLPKTVPSEKAKPETFNFLGFTHIKGKDRNGRFMLIHPPGSDDGTLAKAIKDGLRRRWHYSIPEQGKWLRRVVQGYLNITRYKGLPTMQKFRTHVQTSGAGARAQEPEG
ncbi:RNA-directed DNA polymerase [Klebsiella pneumoniae]|nr:RNA-directed DNA polymerase [Klebsiella pneumoniae]